MEVEEGEEEINFLIEFRWFVSCFQQQQRR
jgi:hypothetical protein